MPGGHQASSEGHIPEVHTSFNEGGKNAASTKTKDFMNEVSGNSSATDPSHQHTTDCSKKGQCDTDAANHAGSTEIRGIQEKKCCK